MALSPAAAKRDRDFEYLEALTIEYLEKSGIFSLGNKFAKRLHDCGGSSAGEDTTSTGTPNTDPLQLPGAFSLADAATPVAHRRIAKRVATVPAALDERPRAVVERPRVVTPERPATKPPAKKARAARPSGPGASDRLPTERDPQDEGFRATLYTSKDERRLHPGHVLLRKKLLRVCRTRSGQVYFQCAACQHLPVRDRVKQSTIAPRSVERLYIGAVRFMMHHVYECGLISDTDKDICRLKVKLNGTKAYWITSAKAIGLRNAGEGKGIIYRGSR